MAPSLLQLPASSCDLHTSHQCIWQMCLQMLLQKVGSHFDCLTFSQSSIINCLPSCPFSTCCCSLLLVRAAGFTACLPHLSRILHCLLSGTGLSSNKCLQDHLSRPQYYPKTRTGREAFPPSCMPLHFWPLSSSYFSARRVSGCFVRVYLCSVNGCTSCSKGRSEASISDTSENSDLNLFLSWCYLQISGWYSRTAPFMLPTFILYLFCSPVASSLAEITCVLGLELPVCLVLVQPEA